MVEYFIADTHFEHDAIIKFCDRPFESITEMNRTLVENWNNRVTNNDHIYVVGDLFYGGRDMASQKKAIEIVRNLNGVKHLITGNHDLPYLANPEYHSLFADINNMRQIKCDGENVFLCHYPIAEWSGYFRGSYHIYGHIHNHKNAAFLHMRNIETALNASVEIIHYMPVTFSELKIYNEAFKVN